MIGNPEVAACNHKGRNERNMNELSIEIVRDTVVLTVHERWPPDRDDEIAIGIRNELAALLSVCVWNAVADFQDAPIFRSNVLGIMISVRNQIHAMGGVMALCNLSNSMRQKLQRLKLSSLWLIEGSLSDAIDAIGDSESR